jgi:hypothetical protein
MARSVDQLVEEVRSQLDETNVENVSDDQIVAALNRAQRKAANIVGRKFDEMFWESTTITTTGGQRDYEIPAQAFGRRVELIEVAVGNTVYPLKRINQSKRSQFANNTQVSRPYYYAMKRNRIQLFPEPSEGLTIHIHYMRRPEELVMSRGRITQVDADNSYIYVDAVDTNLTTSVTDGYNAYINIIDFETGRVKRSCYITEIYEDDNWLVLGNGSRSTVLSRTINGDLLSTTSFGDGTEDNTPEVDDYICIITGTCVPELDDAYADYLIQHAIVGIRRRFGEPINEEMIELRDQEEELKKMWAGRESSNRVRKANTNFTRPLGGAIRRLLS